MSTLEPSRAWILGLTVGTDGRIEPPAEVDDDLRPLGPGDVICECPDDCRRDHPNE